MRGRHFLKYLIKSLALFAVLTAGLPANAQKVKTVSASYTFYAPGNFTLEEAKREALQRAQIEAIANEFGTIIGQSNTTQTRNENGTSKMDFSSLRWSDVKGEWIETIGQPEYKIDYANNLLVVTCEVKGRAREISRAVIDLVAKPLRNGTEPRFEAYDFRDGDDLYLYFETPVDGYLAVYLLDEMNQVVYNILPYKSQNKAATNVKANTEYVFFSKNHGEKAERQEIDEYALTADSGREFNTLYILFSPAEMGKQKGFESDDSSLPKSVAYKDFQSWLSKTLSRDNNIQLIQQTLTIDK